MAKKDIKKRRKRAFFITIEGSEGAGKSSVITHLKNLLERHGNSVRVFREPGSTYIGEQIRDILLDRKNKELSLHTELLLYLAARTQLIEETLSKALYNYDFIICDRFYDSTIVYQGFALGLGKVAADAVRTFSLGVKPNLTFILDAPAKIGLGRIKEKDRIESRPISFHNKLRKGLKEIALREPERVKIINAKCSLDDIYVKVEKVLKDQVKGLDG